MYKTHHAITMRGNLSIQLLTNFRIRCRLFLCSFVDPMQSCHRHPDMLVWNYTSNRVRVDKQNHQIQRLYCKVMISRYRLLKNGTISKLSVNNADLELQAICSTSKNCTTYIPEQSICVINCLKDNIIGLFTSAIVITRNFNYNF